MQISQFGRFRERGLRGGYLAGASRSGSAREALTGMAGYG
jgi:hypothetical protein